MKIDISKTGYQISDEMKAKALAANALLHSGEGAGNDFLGWVKLPSSITDADLDAIEAAANKLREKCDLVICIGIGGSYLGAKAVLEAMSNPFQLLKKESMSKGVVVKYGENKDLIIELHIAVDQGINIAAICHEIQDEVSYKVTKATGIPVSRVDIYVDTMMLG